MKNIQTLEKANRIFDHNRNQCNC